MGRLRKTTLWIFLAIVLTPCSIFGQSVEGQWSFGRIFDIPTGIYKLGHQVGIEGSYAGLLLRVDLFLTPEPVEWDLSVGYEKSLTKNLSVRLNYFRYDFLERKFDEGVSFLFPTDHVWNVETTIKLWERK